MKKSTILSIAVTLCLTFGLIETTQAQLLSTKLKITVIDDLGNVVEGAKITVYKTKDDYMNSENPFMSAMTQEKGIVKLKGLDPISYFIDVRTEDKSNDGKGAKIAPLDEGRMNTINIVIE